MVRPSILKLGRNSPTVILRLELGIEKTLFSFTVYSFLVFVILSSKIILAALHLPLTESGIIICDCPFGIVIPDPGTCCCPPGDKGPCITGPCGICPAAIVPGACGTGG